MKHPLPRVPRALRSRPDRRLPSAVAAVLAAALLGGTSACSKTPSEPVSSRAAGSTVASSASSPAAGPSSSHALLLRPVLETSAERKLTPPVDLVPLPQPTRPPTWDLASDDPAREYARRYVFFTKRYADGLACADFGASQPAGGQRRVEVKAAAACAAAGTVRDVFLVDLAGDHISVDDKAKRDPLARWPDGSDPEGPAGSPVPEITVMKKWTGPVKDALAKHELVALRVQSYGRGTYPVLSLAGWHNEFQKNAPPDALKALAADLCAANQNMPMGLFNTLDRVDMLRIRCPGPAVWEQF